MITQNEIGRLTDADAYGTDGEKIGSVGQVFLGTDSNEPEWVTVKTGLFGTKESFVPLPGAGGRPPGPPAGAGVTPAPRIDTDRALSYSEENELYSYYGLGSGDGSTTSTTGSTTSTTGSTDEFQGGTGSYDDTRTETGDADGDDSMTRSEERLVAGTRTEETGKARLRKYVVTEQQQVNVPVTREEVTLEREPITDGDAGDAYDGPAITESEHEVTLYAARPVVDTEAVAVERVRLGKETVTDTETVRGEVRKEQIDFDGPENRRTN